jgi:hypothetical protein
LLFAYGSVKLALANRKSLYHQKVKVCIAKNAKVCITKKQKSTPRKKRRKYALVHSDHASKTEVLTER